VRRGELNLDSSVVDEWRRELKKANEGKVGEPYRYPESYTSSSPSSGSSSTIPTGRRRGSSTPSPGPWTV
jgi:hypothetical protein